MAKFMYLFRGGGYAGSVQLSPTEVQQHLAKWNEWSEGLRAAGRLASAQPLSHPPTGKTVRGRESGERDTGGRGGFPRRGGDLGAGVPHPRSGRLGRSPARSPRAGNGNLI